MWTTYPDLGGIIKSTWDGENNILIVISSFQKNVTTWNRNTFGNIFYKLKIIAKRLKGIHKSPHYSHSTFQTNLNKKLIKEHNYLLKVEEDFWKLRSRVIWLNDGDANTRFFHTTTLNRRRRNKIIVLQKEEGDWTYDPQEIQNITFTYFKNLFTIGKTFVRIPYERTDKFLTNSIYHSIGDIPIEEGILDTIKSFQPLKAPGPDGLHPLFYQKYWDIVGNSTIQLCKNAFINGHIPEEINRTHLCLIPKNNNASNIKDFRPISLCNTTCKIITKIIARRLW